MVYHLLRRVTGKRTASFLALIIYTIMLLLIFWYQDFGDETFLYLTL